MKGMILFFTAFFLLGTAVGLSALTVDPGGAVVQASSENAPVLSDSEYVRVAQGVGTAMVIFFTGIVTGIVTGSLFPIFAPLKRRLRRTADVNTNISEYPTKIPGVTVSCIGAGGSGDKRTISNVYKPTEAQG